MPSLPVTERLTRQSLILPLFHGITEAEQDLVVSVLADAAGVGRVSPPRQQLVLVGRRRARSGDRRAGSSHQRGHAALGPAGLRGRRPPARGHGGRRPARARTHRAGRHPGCRGGDLHGTPGRGLLAPGVGRPARPACRPAPGADPPGGLAVQLDRGRAGLHRAGRGGGHRPGVDGRPRGGHAPGRAHPRRRDRGLRHPGLGGPPGRRGAGGHRGLPGGRRAGSGRCDGGRGGVGRDGRRRAGRRAPR